MHDAPMSLLLLACFSFFFWFLFLGGALCSSGRGCFGEVHPDGGKFSS